MSGLKVAGWWEGMPGKHAHSVPVMPLGVAWCQGQESVSVLTLFQESGKGSLLEITMCIPNSLLFSIYHLSE